MKGFALDDKGDLLIENGEIVMVNGPELLRQNVKMVLSTNKGEWSLNIDEGINFANVLGTVRTMVSADDRQTTLNSAEIERMKREEAKLNVLLQQRLEGGD